MKRPEYKTVKWEKCVATLINDKEDNYNELNSLRTEYLNGDIDEVRYYLVCSSCYEAIAENYFIEGDFSAFKENIKYSLDAFLKALKLFKEGKTALEATKSSISEDIEDGYFGYLALIISDYDALPQVTLPNSSLMRMLSGKEIEEETDDFVNAMERAIVLNNSEMFEMALANRIKEIRKVPEDDYDCLDWWSIALVQEAKKAGMQSYSDYIEVDLKARKDMPAISDVRHRKTDKVITVITKTNKKEMAFMSEEKLMEFIKSCSEKMEEIMQDEEDVDLCEKVFIKDIEAYEQLLSISFDKYAKEAANEYCIFADFYSQLKPNKRKAVKASTRKLEICKKMAQKDKSLMDEVAYSYIELGEIYENNDNEKRQKKCIRKQRKSILRNLSGMVVNKSLDWRNKMEVTYNKVINNEKDNRVEFVLINFDYIDGNDYLVKLFSKVYGFTVDEKIDGLWYRILRIRLADSEYELLWHEDFGNEIYCTNQTREENELLQQRLENVLGILNHRIKENKGGTKVL